MPRFAVLSLLLGALGCRAEAALPQHQESKTLSAPGRVKQLTLEQARQGDGDAGAPALSDDELDRLLDALQEEVEAAER